MQQVAAILNLTAEKALFCIPTVSKITAAAVLSVNQAVDSMILRHAVKGIADSLGLYDLNGGEVQWQVGVLKILEEVKKIDPRRRKEIVEAIITRFKSAARTADFQIEVENNVFTPLTHHQVSLLTSQPLITIGAHSHCHNLLDQIPQEQAKISILKSKEILEYITGLKVQHFAYPNGNFNADLMRVVKDLGFKSAVTYKRGFYKNGSDPSSINRFGVGAGVSIEVFKAMLTGIFDFKKLFTHHL